MRVVNSVSDNSLDHISDAEAHWDMVLLDKLRGARKSLDRLRGRPLILFARFRAEADLFGRPS